MHFFLSLIHRFSICFNFLFLYFSHTHTIFLMIYLTYLLAIYQHQHYCFLPPFEQPQQVSLSLRWHSDSESILNLDNKTSALKVYGFSLAMLSADKVKVWRKTGQWTGRRWVALHLHSPCRCNCQCSIQLSLLIYAVTGNSRWGILPLVLINRPLKSLRQLIGRCRCVPKKSSDRSFELWTLIYSWKRG